MNRSLKVRSLKKVWIPAAAGASAGAVFYYMRRRARSKAAVDIPNARPSKLSRRVEDCVLWRFSNRFALIEPGKTLRLELTSPAIVRWSTDGWDTVHDSRTVEMDGAHVADIDTIGLAPGERVQFTFYWPGANRWEGQDFDVRLAERARYGGALSD